MYTVPGAFCSWYNLVFSLVLFTVCYIVLVYTKTVDSVKRAR